MASAQHEVTDELDINAIAARFAQIEAGVVANVDPIEVPHEDVPENGVIHIEANVDRAVPPEPYRWYRPLSDAADEYVRFAKSFNRRVFFGIAEIDAATRGIAPRELANVMGFAHSGKTVLVTEMVLRNRTKRIAWFTPDETRVLVLVKLCAAVHDIDAEELEQRLKDDDPEAERLLRSVATEHFPHLAVWDDLTFDAQHMSTALDEAEQVWGGKCELAIFDYVELFEGGEDVKQKFNALKAWGKQRDLPLVVMHQTSKTGGGPGKEVTMTSGAYGGEQQSIFMIGVRRKRDEIKEQIREAREKANNAADPTKHLERISELEYELRKHQSSITLNLVKNKRPPSKLVADIDFELDARTGRIRPYDMRAAARGPRATDFLPQPPIF